VKVRELIEALKALPQDQEVLTGHEALKHIDRDLNWLVTHDTPNDWATRRLWADRIRRIIASALQVQ
jgi:hypothetical protein